MHLNRTVTRMALAAAVLVALVGCSSGGSSKGDEKPFGDVAKGKEIFTGNCVSCHGPDGKGITGLGKNLVQRSEWMKKQSNEQLLAFIKTGRPASDPLNTTHVEMPPRGGNPDLTGEDLTNVVAYIRSIQQK